MSATNHCLPLSCNMSTSTFVPNPLQPVPAPTVCVASAGSLVRMLAIQLGSVRGVRSSRRCRCWKTKLFSTHKHALEFTHSSNAVVRCFPATRFPHNGRGRRCKRMIEPCVVRPEENVVHSESKSAQDKQTCRHNTLGEFSLSFSTKRTTQSVHLLSARGGAKHRCRAVRLQIAVFLRRTI